mmetsp:Transcript_46207/g.75135  ORF Transcript_46207/g.75135 Transcript_46207/m.75135 type:complete len:264 (-) Transcript_46207:51-842(-)
MPGFYGLQPQQGRPSLPGKAPTRACLREPEAESQSEEEPDMQPEPELDEDDEISWRSQVQVILQEGIVTVMIRNIPYSCNPDIMLLEFDLRGFSGTYDFFWCPRRPGNGNYGYAVVNFSNARDAKLFRKVYHDSDVFKAPGSPNLSVTASVLQGFKANYDSVCRRYQQSQQSSREFRVFDRSGAGEQDPRHDMLELQMPVLLVDFQNQSLLAHFNPLGQQDDVMEFQEGPVNWNVYQNCQQCGKEVSDLSFRFCVRCGVSVVC